MGEVVKIRLYAFSFFLLMFLNLAAQQENVQIDHNVYTFLKDMKLKGLISNLRDDDPSLSRAAVAKFLCKIDSSFSQLSNTEYKLLKKYQVEFYDDFADSNNTMQFFGNGFGQNDFTDYYSDKLKQTYSYKEPDVNVNLEVLGRIMYGQFYKPIVNNTWLFDIGFRLRGTLFNKLAYSLTTQKGGVKGVESLAPAFDPRLVYNFKFFEDVENIGNYDFAEGYLKYHAEPINNMNIDLQLGREKIKFGYGYGSKLVISGEHTYLDFLKLNFDYGIFSFTSLTGSTVGEFKYDRNENFTKYITLNRFKINFPKLFEFGLGEDIIYSGRGVDLAYLNPFIFHKFVEMSLQDRDNGSLWLDFQTHFIKNFEVSATFFLDEDILSQLQNLNLFSNKTAYQFGAMWYAPFSINDLSLVFEYTKIRPYVYSHDNYKNSYTAYGQLLGHPIGPNSDEILWKANYNYNEWIRFGVEYKYIRSGENIYDSQGNLSFNAGGNPFQPYRYDIDPKKIEFLDGERINQNILTVSVKLEPVRELFFDVVYRLTSFKNITREFETTNSIAYIKMYFEL